MLQVRLRGNLDVLLMLLYTRFVRGNLDVENGQIFWLKCPDFDMFDYSFRGSTYVG